MNFTVLGASGFVGRHLCDKLLYLGYEVDAYKRQDDCCTQKNLGHVIYSIGFTGNFRQKPFDAVEAHVCYLTRLLQKINFESFLYLSSTRIYGVNKKNDSFCEKSPISIYPSQDSLYDLSKLLGESVCLSIDNPKVRVARLSNVFGDGQSMHTFLGSLLDSAVINKYAFINEPPMSSKDYIHIDNVTEGLIKIAINGRERMYNVASGHGISHFEIGRIIEKVLHVPVDFNLYGAARIMANVNTSRFHSEFPECKGNVKNQLVSYIKKLKKKHD